MYHALVRRVILTIYDHLNAGRVEAVVGYFAGSAQHYFIGQHALGGARHTRAAIRRWYERLFSLFPDIRFEVQRITVSGWPWWTLATVEWTETNSGTDGVRTHNGGLNVAELRWGKITRLGIYPDTAGLHHTLDRLARAGHPAAALAPIID